MAGTTNEMPQYIAFLRGINVGGHRVKMDRLQELFEEMGLKNISTFESISSDRDQFRFSRTEVHWRVQGKISESPLFGRVMERLGGLATTTRNMNTIRRIAAKVSHE